MFTLKSRARLLMASAALAAAAVMAPLSASAATVSQTAATAAAPATVAVRSGWFGANSMDWGYCLDSNAKGAVYLNPCQVPGNHYQDWIWTEWKAYSPYSGYYYFYSIKDEETGRCLDSNNNGAWGNVYTNPCQAPGNAYQDWYWSAGNSPGFTKFTDVATGLSLWGSGSLPNPVVTSDQVAYLNWMLIQ